MKKKLDWAIPIRHVVGIMFFIIIAVTCTQVICRYVFNNSLVWSEELVRFLVVWMCMIGAAIACFDDSHMTINTFLAKMPVKLQFSLYSLRQFAILAFCLMSSLSSFKLVRTAWNTTSGALGIPMGLWRAAGTVGLLLCALFTMLRYGEDLIKFKNHQFIIRDDVED